MKADPFSGAVYVFRAKRADRVKLIFWDGTGVCLFAKRLEDGEFRWPKMQDGVMRLTAAQLSALAGRARLAAGSRGAGDGRRRCSRHDVPLQQVNQPASKRSRRSATHDLLAP